VITTRASSTLSNSSPVQHLVAHLAVEALDEGVLLWTRLLHEDRVHAALSQPLDDRRRDQLSTVVGADATGVYSAG
jgi:hypothetical protein